MNTNLLIPDGDRQRLLACTHNAPHDIYGWHPHGDGSIIRTRFIGAERVELLIHNASQPMQPLGDDIWATTLDDTHTPDYRYRITYPGADPIIVADAYNFLPTLGSLDIHLINEGRHERLWEVLGANTRTYETTLGVVTGTSFAVWAPNATGVAVIGDFCSWNPSQYPMRSLGVSGVWEIFIPGIGDGDAYKFAIHTADGTRIDKADPLAKRTLTPPETVSVVAKPSEFEWSDHDWITARAGRDATNSAMSIYECHIGSWKQGSTYATLTDELVPYLVDNGYTHVEFLPVAEHPFGGSWGYQVTGYYAPTARWGSPDDFRRLVDTLHANGIGVIVDWVPAHFPKDDFALARFDGTPLYEHPDWRRGEQRDWGTYVFNYGRREVRNFLVANALYWFEEFHLDGIRVDAVASMLYLDYSREPGEWLPNQHGGREHWEAVQFLQELNATVHREHPGVLTIAEESTAWPGVTAQTDADGLGFSMKWNMGWMNDTLEYFSLDPVHRSHHHNEITFSLVYAFSERYVLPFSHDEVVHGKGSLWQRMPGDDWNKAAGLRALYGYMYSHPGKPLMFMGCEWGQTTEWDEAHSINWDDLHRDYHAGIKRLVRDLNLVYRDTPALYSQDNTPMGFQWIKGDDASNNVLAYIRWGVDATPVLAVINLSGVSLPNYRLGLPEAGAWDMLINTDESVYGGAGNELPRTVHTEPTEWDRFDQSIELHLPAMSVQYYVLRR
ncbi:1,4-alpha-glucan branching protein GlgB [Corynebacterium coyleae]|uniref:1,4-alpha-glucan branching protein GlgB n=1 Tax=Corynebacterium coyleae TaxID=53374 RepID=UPI0025519C73|nr:1,4-alpha-glucan branching protein GlgB [Corynebacterium coyleae]MDK8663257.1 1,4-alpha-glucan branching protein GlgB [Corynebacterium coyleae]MDK8706397.1 1,4-alpha-glucan branching protein GlgB [Corynebacterium coyleae]MDK8733212.1 1,4-alpha-glucan branching protein GlgB [Corynebacterium coyleae]MDK8892439.1 1,4-alpha-glucan branching protein GlgB [Corynebacterium coyleae]